MIILRNYQKEAVEAALKAEEKDIVITAATGAGKSHIIAELSERINGKILCIAPSKELVEQNYQKYVDRGFKASIYSASAGKKCLRHSVIFGTPLTILNSHKKFSDITTIIVDECHGISPTIRKIIKHLVPDKVIGLTATPYRMLTGFIYREDETGKLLGDDKSKNPYFDKCVYNIGAQYLIDQGYLTNPVCLDNQHEQYNTRNLKLDKMGNFTTKSLNEAITDRKTKKIVQDILENTQARNGVLIFATSVKHAQDIQAMINGSKYITGATSKSEREQIINDFKEQKFKYLVNVAVLTTGFDAPHVDAIAVLRPTESAGLFQQIIGRGLRLYEGKEDCLILDYAENIDRHNLDDDLFNPEISAIRDSNAELIEVECPSCSYENKFIARFNPDKLAVSQDGYFLDLMGAKMDMPSHYGRRCQGYITADTRCGYRWTFRECPECGHENDIAARHCEECKYEIIDPDEKLKLDFKKFKADPSNIQTDKVISVSAKYHISKSGNSCLKLDWKTEYRNFVTFHNEGNYFWEKLFKNQTIQSMIQIINNQNHKPETISYRKKDKFFEVLGFNGTPDGV